jgi:hypothetical protein
MDNGIFQYRFSFCITVNFEVATLYLSSADVTLWNLVPYMNWVVKMLNTIIKNFK